MYFYAYAFFYAYAYCYAYAYFYTYAFFYAMMFLIQTSRVLVLVIYALTKRGMSAEVIRCNSQ